jgi:hypothetical protein
MAMSEFVEEGWKLAIYAIIVLVFIGSLLYAWHNYQSSLGYAEKIRETRMLALALLEEWGEDGVIDLSRASEDDLPENAAVRFYAADGRLLKAVGDVEGDGITVKIPIVAGGEEGCMLLSLGW